MWMDINQHIRLNYITNQTWPFGHISNKCQEAAALKLAWLNQQELRNFAFFRSKILPDMWKFAFGSRCCRRWIRLRGQAALAPHFSSSSPPSYSVLVHWLGCLWLPEVGLQRFLEDVDILIKKMPSDGVVSTQVLSALWWPKYAQWSLLPSRIRSLSSILHGH